MVAPQGGILHLLVFRIAPLIVWEMSQNLLINVLVGFPVGFLKILTGTSSISHCHSWECNKFDVLRQNSGLGSRVNHAGNW